MAWKINHSTSPMYICCYCCHVRTGTLFLGLIQMMGYAVILSTLAMALMHPGLAESVMPSSGTMMLSSTLAPVLSGGIANDHQNPLMYHSRSTDRESLIVGILFTMAMMSICGGLIYGTIRGEPKHIMPFLCIQIFDAFISGIAMIIHLSNAQNLRKWIEAQKFFSGKQFILDLDDDHLMLWALFIFMLAMFIKLYFIRVVWSCYNYLKNELNSSNSLAARHYEIQITSSHEDAEMLLPPKYEDVMLVPADGPEGQPIAAPMPPPEYTEH